MKGRTLVAVLVWCLLVGFHVSAAAVELVGVRHVLDGDTVILEDGRTVRYIGIDAPEIAHEEKPGQPFGLEAKAFNEKQLAGKRVRLVFERERRDRYGRVLAHLFTGDGGPVAEAILAAGLAHCLPNRPNTRYADKFLALQREAMGRGRGKWHEWQKVPGPFTGNRRSLRVHREDCPFGRRTARRNRIRFDNLWQAFYAGYAPCKVCLGVDPGMNSAQNPR